MRKKAFTPLQINVYSQKKLKNKPMYQKGKFVTGFTLIELLIVVVIIGVLATMMYPQFEGFILRAKLKEIANTVQLIVAGEKYYFFKTGSYRTFAKGDYATDNTIEADLNITIPKGTSAFCLYQVFNSNRGDMNVYAKDEAPTIILYAVDGPTGASTKNLNHPYCKYITADSELAF